MSNKITYRLLRSLKLLLPLLVGMGLFTLHARVGLQESKPIQWHWEQPKTSSLVSTEDLMPLAEVILGPDGTAANLDELEKSLASHPAVKNCEAWKTANGTLHIQIQERVPVLRLVHSSGRHRYIDKENYALPAFLGAPFRVPIVTGVLPLAPEGRYLGQDSLFARLNRLQHYMAQDSFWLAMTEQIDVLPDTQFVLIPKLGQHEVWLGSMEHMPGKLLKMKHFYTFGLHEEGWTEYKYIDARFKGQVVCRKSLPTNAAQELEMNHE